LPRRCAPRNGHNSHKLLLFLYIPIKRPKDKPVLSKKILYSYRQKELIFYYHYWIYSINMLKIIAMLLIRIKIQILPATIYDYYARNDN